MKEQYIEWIIRLLSAILAGAIIGIERQIKGKSAGLKTISLISIGSCLFMIASEIVGGDPGRIAAQVVTGIGFLGAGVIIFAKDHVLGLTTAAVIWVSAGIGMIIGPGNEIFVILLSMFIVIILICFGYIEKKFIAKEYKKPDMD
jgi:putative Mg2+ transporter-C (MgtC) family protein